MLEVLRRLIEERRQLRFTYATAVTLSRPSPTARPGLQRLGDHCRGEVEGLTLAIRTICRGLRRV